MKNVYFDFVELHKVCKENNVERLHVFFYSCKICGSFYGTFDKTIIVCSDNCNEELIQVNKNLISAEIKAKSENWCLGNEIKIGEEAAFVVITTFSLKEIAKGISRFNYLINFNKKNFAIKNTLPLKKEYENISLIGLSNYP